MATGRDPRERLFVDRAGPRRRSRSKVGATACRQSSFRCAPAPVPVRPWVSGPVDRRFSAVGTLPAIPNLAGAGNPSPPPP